MDQAHVTPLEQFLNRDEGHVIKSLGVINNGKYNSFSIDSAGTTSDERNQITLWNALASSSFAKTNYTLNNTAQVSITLSIISTR